MFNKRRSLLISLSSLFALSLGLNSDNIWASNDQNQTVEIPINTQIDRVIQYMPAIVNHLKSVQKQAKISIQKPFKLAVENDSVSFERSFDSKQIQQTVCPRDMKEQGTGPQTENDQLSKKLEKQKGELDSMIAAASKLRKEIAELQNRKAKAQQKEDTLSKIKQQLKEEKEKNEKLTKQNEDSKRDLEQRLQESYNQASNDLHQEISRLRKEIQQKDKKIDEQTRDFLNSDEVQLRKENTALRKKIKDLTQGFNQQIDALNKGQEKLARTFNESRYVQRLQKTLDENKSLQNELDVLHGSLVALISANSIFLAELSNEIKKTFSHTNAHPSESQEDSQASSLIQILQTIDLGAHSIFVQTLASFLNFPSDRLQEFLNTFDTKEVCDRMLKTQNVQEQINIFKENQPKDAFGLSNYPKALENASMFFSGYSNFFKKA